MAQARKQCTHPRCPHQQPCPQHPPAQPWAGSTRTDTSDTWWRATRARIILRDPTCTCTDPGGCHPGTTCTRPSTTADHLIPRAEGGTDDDDNLGGKCWPCHQRKSSLEGNRGKQRKAARRTVRPD